MVKKAISELTEKTTLTANDTFVIVDSAANETKKVVWSNVGSGISLTTPIIPSFYQDAGKTKLMTVPNTASDTLVTLAATQTLTSKTLTSPTINGTIATTGLTLPAVTLGGTVTGANQNVTGLGALMASYASFDQLTDLPAGYRTAQGSVDLLTAIPTVGNQYPAIIWGDSTFGYAMLEFRPERRTGINQSDASLVCHKLYAVDGSVHQHIKLYTSNAAGTPTSRVAITYLVDTAVALWGNVTHEGLKLSGVLDANGESITGFNSFISYDSVYSFLQRTGAKGFTWRTANAADDAAVERFNLSGGLATAVATWANVTHTGLVLGGNMTVTGYAFDAGAGSVQINTTGGGQGLIIQSTQDGATAALLHLKVLSSSPDVGDVLGNITFSGKNSAGSELSYGKVLFKIADPTSTSEDGSIEWQIRENGSLNSSMTLSGAGALWTDASVDTLLYKVSGTQVVGARVVDARCDDVVDSTYGAEEAGVLDALRDAMITHGLIAAA